MHGTVLQYSSLNNFNIQNNKRVVDISATLFVLLYFRKTEEVSISSSVLYLDS